MGSHFTDGLRVTESQSTSHELHEFESLSPTSDHLSKHTLPDFNYIMTTSISIPSTLPSSSQYILIRRLIQQSTITCTIFGEENSFIPISVVNALATRANIEAMVQRDPGLRAMYFPEHSRSFFINHIYKYAKGLFLVAVAERLGMNFLRVLMRGKNTVDRNLPLDMHLRIRDGKNEFWPDEDVKRFLGIQNLVCAPRFYMNSYKQVAGCRSGLPIVEARRVAGRDDEEREVYEVRFHDEHLRPSKSAEPGEEWVLGKRFLMRCFAERGEATRDPSFEEAVFGFSCQGMYYLVGAL
jgi:hypothetical protein